MCTWEFTKKYYSSRWPEFGDLYTTPKSEKVWGRGQTKQKRVEASWGGSKMWKGDQEHTVNKGCSVRFAMQNLN